MENCADANFEFAFASNASANCALDWSKWPEIGVGVKRSFSWNGFTTTRRRRLASPNLFDDDDDVNERNLSSESIRSSRLNASVVESCLLPDSFCCQPLIASQNGTSLREPSHDNQSIASLPKSITTRISNNIFNDGEVMAINFLSPGRRSIGARSEDLFSSMDVAYDTQSVDLFSDCETNIDFSELNTLSPDLFDDSNSSKPESVVDPLQNDDVIDLTQNENEEPGPNEENAIVPLMNSIQSRDVSNSSQRLVVAENGDNNVQMTHQSLLAFSEEQHMRMYSEPNILLERLLGCQFILPNTAPVPDHLNDGTTTVFSGEDASGPEIDDEAKEMLRKIERLIVDTLTELSEGKRLELVVRRRTDWSNTHFDDNIFTLLPVSQANCRRIRSTYLLSLMFYLLGEIYEMISLNRTCTTRELYYSNTTITEKQENVNEALKNICCKLEVTPWQLGVRSSVKGLLAGNIKIYMADDVVIDCSLHIDGILLPHCTSGIERMTTDAKYVLLVEKDTVFKKLAQYNISKHFGTECLLITGKGYPDTNTRLILKKIWDSHHLPIYALTDADPHGIEIMLTYRHGSLAMSNISDELAVPSIRWCGILPSDIEKFGIKSIPMTAEDRRKLDALMKRPGLNDNVYRELQWLQRNNEKAEIEGLSGSSSHYLIDVYLRHQFVNKIAI